MRAKEENVSDSSDNPGQLVGQVRRFGAGPQKLSLQRDTQRSDKGNGTAARRGKEMQTEQETLERYRSGKKSGVRYPGSKLFKTILLGRESKTYISEDSLDRGTWESGKGKA